MNYPTWGQSYGTRNALAIVSVVSICLSAVTILAAFIKW